MNKVEALEVLYAAPKESAVEDPSLFDAMVAVAKSGEFPEIRYDEAMDELVGGGQTHDPRGNPLDDPCPTIRYTRP